MKYKLLFLISFSLTSIITSQEKINFKGQILDNKTKSPIPFAALVIKGKNLGIYASEDGEFTFNTTNIFFQIL